ncbi:hypothetical protein TCCBUS3UF1_20420 [Thermus sp. CCB_US3_UF1]|nr:hypothetical protein TCCBUS3UF1_20420 [Thermus sp. CCB_US3_UF1]
MSFTINPPCRRLWRLEPALGKGLGALSGWGLVPLSLRP